MQLSGNKKLRNTLTAVTAALIGSSAVHAAEGDKLQSSLLIYSETSRVKAGEAIVAYSHPLTNGRSVFGKITFDALTGPSPNGAAPSNGIQTFTRPSGSGSYDIQPGDSPLDDTFKDTRISFDGSYNIPLDRVSTFNVGAHLSTEHDYTSLSANFGISRDFNRRNTTLSFSSSFAHDLVRPEGQSPTPFSSLPEPGTVGENDGFEDEGDGGRGSESKNVIDAVIGLTQVVDRMTLLRVNYSLTHASGYLNDPYKILSLVQDQNSADPGEPVDYLYESRPDKHTKHAVFGELQRYISGHVINISYRYFWDDWGIRSNTFDFHYRFPLPGNHALEPHLRWYKQTEADFYRSFLVDSSPLPTNASADYRLAPFHAITVGLQYSLPLDQRTRFKVGGEYYHQSGDISPPSNFGALSRYDLFPKLDAVMVRLGIDYDF